MKGAHAALGVWILNYLVNAAWQIAVLFLTAKALSGTVRRPAMQHRLWVGTLITAALLPACGGPSRAWASKLWLCLVRLLAAHPSSLRSSVIITSAPGEALGTLRLSPAVLFIVLVFYGIVLLYFGVRLLHGFLETVRLRRQASPFSLLGEARVGWERLRSTFGIPHVTLALSAGVSGPVVLGMGRPVLLLPAAALATVEARDLHAALAHECAHLQRNDFRKSLAYHLLALPIAFHPFTWFMLRGVAWSREMVCDEMAAEAVSGRPRYAHSLLRLAKAFAAPAQVRTFHAIGFSDANSFERRVMSLTESRHREQGLRHTARIAAGALLALSVCSSALAFRVNLAPVWQGAASQTAAPLTRVSGGVMAGNILAKVQPVYPQAAKEAKVSGSVVLHAIIGKDGAIENLSVLSGPEELRASAFDAVRQWTYKPYLLNGDPVEVETNITVTYSLSN